MAQLVRNSRRPTRKTIGIGVAVLGLFCLALATEGTQAKEAKPNRYIGAAKCMNCHKFEGGGNQYDAWLQAKHSSAYDVLAGEEAKRVAKERGIDDPQKSDACLKCHITGHGKSEELFAKGFDAKLGVQCETCHGPGEAHLRARFRAAATEEETPEGEVPKYVVVPDGEIITTPTRDVCLSCHNKESPSFKSFCFYERIAKIRHLDPRKPRTKEQLAAMLVCGCGEECACVHECPEDGCGVPPKDE